MASQALSAAAEPSSLHMRARTVMALALAPAFPMGGWFAALDEQISRAGAFFTSRAFVVDVSGILAGGPEAPFIILDGLEARGLRIIAVEGVERRALAGSRWEGLVGALPGREVAAEEPQADAPAATAPSLLVDRPVRSGQSVVFEAGDVTILGAVASGAEVIAGGSIHVYGALRGRAVAGLRVGAEARIFCRRLEAEMVGVDRLYRTAEHWGLLHGQPAQVLCDRGALRLSELV
jgi:septum site-determining protein MinC